MKHKQIFLDMIFQYTVLAPAIQNFKFPRYPLPPSLSHVLPHRSVRQSNALPHNSIFFHSRPWRPDRVTLESLAAAIPASDHPYWTPVGDAGGKLGLHFPVNTLHHAIHCSDAELLFRWMLPGNRHGT